MCRVTGRRVLARPLLQACIAVCPKNPASFNVDNVRVVKIPGGGVHDSAVVRGMVLKRDTEVSFRLVAYPSFLRLGPQTGRSTTKPERVHDCTMCPLTRPGAIRR